ncbi:hypothetical protein [Luteimonas aquatica]|uniref:hypothetical protein n=1 Tax=Luteimonas aquatica TaxID=450364 RepID=UPI001F5A8777|nr:hypothetical protein [Luteimonas aquatica]
MTDVQRLRIGSAQACDRIDGAPRQWDVTEFLVDERPLAERLGIARDLLFCGTDLDAGLPPALRERGRDMFLGRTGAMNQFGSGRLVLYRCHCGCDYCGVASCRLEVAADRVYWHDVTFEDDDGPAMGQDARTPSLPRLTPVARIVFDRAQYEQQIRHHLAR